MFISTSPYLMKGNEPGKLHECPVGMVLREAPQAYDAISAYGSGEHINQAMLYESLYLRAAFRVIGSEKNRLMQLDAQEKKTRLDARYGAGVRSRGR